MFLLRRTLVKTKSFIHLIIIRDLIIDGVNKEKLYFFILNTEKTFYPVNNNVYNS